MCSKNPSTALLADSPARLSFTMREDTKPLVAVIHSLNLPTPSVIAKQSCILSTSAKNSEIRRFFVLKPTKTGKNRKKPVETVEIKLTKRLKRLKVNCGTVLPNPHEY